MANDFVVQNGLLALDASTVSGSLTVTGGITGSVRYTDLISVPAGIVSSSAQINTGSFTGSFTGTFTGTSSFASNATSASFAVTASHLTGTIQSASFATSASFAPTILPAGTVSSSGQVSYTGLANVPAGIVSSSTQIPALLPAGTVSASSQVVYTSLTGIPAGIVSSSGQVSYTGLSNIPAGIVSSSGQISYTGLSNTPANIVSSSAQVTTFLPAGTVSSSAQINTGSFTGSFKGDGTGLTGVTATAFPFTGAAVISGSLTITGSAGLNVTGPATVLGAFQATTKSFKIDHQILLGKKLIYGVLEGPEHGVYVRGRLNGGHVITLPDEWEWLVDEHSITVQLTAINTAQQLYVREIADNCVIVDSIAGATNIDCFYFVQATRKDVASLVTVE